MRKTITATNILYILLILTSAIVGTILFSTTTSPLYNSYGIDSAAFQTIGKYWSSTCLPYVDMFDQKGPMIFLINAAGYFLIDSRMGVLVIQVLFLCLSEFFAYRMLRLKLSTRLSLILAILLPVFLRFDWDEGNMTEEYILPFLFLSYHMMMKWLLGINEKVYEHNRMGAFVYGLTFAFALMSRLTNSIGVCVGVFIISITLVVHRKWKNLLENIVFFCIGAAIIVFPFVLYFGSHGALYEMWYGTVLFNIHYAEKSMQSVGISDISSVIRVFYYGLGMIAVSVFAIFRPDEKKRQGMFWLAVVGSCVFYLSMVNFYPHYSIILLPFLYISLEQIQEVVDNNKKKAVYLVSITLSFCIVVGGAINSLYPVVKYGLDIDPFINHIDDRLEYDDLIDKIPKEERYDFIAYDCPVDLYLHRNVAPHGRYIFFQTWQGSHSIEYTEMMYNHFDDSEIKWVLVRRKTDEKLIIEDILNKKYQLADSTNDGVYELYCLK